MYYVDSQRTLTRRDSSLVVPKRTWDFGNEVEILSSARPISTAQLTSESLASIPPRPEGSVRKEVITILFEAMLEHIVESWEVIPPKADELQVDFGKSPSELTMNLKQKKKAPPTKQTKTGRRSRSRLEIGDTEIAQSTQASSRCSWPDERAVVRFRNGNLYEGALSMKCMNGSGRFQWADGTVYVGQFKEQDICGQGLLQWKDDTWYEGEFLGNLRHGHGLYVDSRRQRSYSGQWHCGTKHGRGVIYYSDTMRNSYDGDWVENVRHGFGTREYCPMSGYHGEWDIYVQEGKGLMIWPNHDFYSGQWKNGVMSGCGMYIWDTIFNKSMSLPSLNAYRGQWEKGERHGYGILNLGMGLGSHYKGGFKNNKKHGVGKLVSNNGLILQNKNLFIDDNIGSFQDDNTGKSPKIVEPFQFDICDSGVGLFYHVEQALKNIDRQDEIRNSLLNEYLVHNKYEVVKQKSNIKSLSSKASPQASPRDIEEVINFEESSLRKALRCYETVLRNIYYKYATICNKEDIDFMPIMIRMYLWQLYYDCEMHKKDLNFVEIDNIFYQNPEWLARSAHNPFEKVYFWQFIHSLVSVASRLYAIKQLPGVKPETILASAFRTFMDKDILPGAGRRLGRFVNTYFDYIPLKSLYGLYRKLGEPHTIRQFLCAVRYSPHLRDKDQPTLVDAPDELLPIGKNCYVYGDEMSFVLEEPILVEDDYDELNYKFDTDLKLFNFGNLSSKTILKIFSVIFPKLFVNQKLMGLDIELTFFEFFEAFFACTEESIRIKDEEIRWREKFASVEFNK